MKNFFNKRYLVYSLTVFFLLAALFSCNKLLEVPSHPDDKLSDEHVYSDSLNVMGALVGLYTNLGVGSNGTIFGVDLTRYMGYYADELSPNDGTAVSDEFLLNEVQVTNSTIGTFWDNSYKGIYRANALLEGITDNDKLSLTLQQQIKGESLLVRALYYFHLVNLFGDVPYVTSTDYKINAKLPRSPVDSVYSLIISDLTTAMDLLSTQYPSAGRARPNQHTARALLARVFLYRKDWKNAADMSSAIISDGAYLLSDLDNTFKDGSTEAIWQVPSVATFGQVAEAQYFAPYSEFDMPYVELTTHQLDAFEANDLRKEAWTGTTVIEGNTYHYVYKYKNMNLEDEPRESLMFFRLAEQYLIRSEANAQQGLLDTARADLNRIRDRAGLDVTTALTKEEVLLAIEHERQTELFCELAQRWFDLKRTGRAPAVLAPIKANWQDRDTLLPVPQMQRQTNPFLTQNPGFN